MIRPLLSLLLICSFLTAQESDTTTVSDTAPSVGSSFPAVLVGVPGGAEIGDHRPVRGGLFILSEALTAGIGAGYLSAYHQTESLEDSLHRSWEMAQSAALVDTTITADRTVLSSLIDLRKVEFDRGLFRARAASYFVWSGLLYGWNVLDGVGRFNHITMGTEPLKPKRAAALAAIPFSGAGQLYNRDLFKAGLVIATQVGCTFTAVNYWNQMRKAEQYQEDLAHDTLYATVGLTDRSSWESRYSSISRLRTMFTWYSVVFYLYGIADASVDAHLQGFNSRFSLTGGVSPDGSASVGISTPIGRKKEDDR